MMTRIAAIGVLILSASQASCAETDHAPIALADVDLNHIYGGWYIVATIPNFLEKGVVGGYDVFSSGKNGEVHEDFFMQRGGFNATKHHFVTDIAVIPNTNHADWRVRPIWPLRLPFQIYYVDPDYRYVLFGQQNRNWGWIYSRTQLIPDADYQDLMAHFRALGYDTTLFRKMIQTEDQIGLPGFWSDGIRKHDEKP